MVEFSSILSAETDAGGRPTGLVLYNASDTVISSMLPTGVQGAITAVIDNSGTWESHTGASAVGFEGWNSTSSTVFDNSGNWETIYGDRANIQSVSATVATSGTAFLTGATPTLSNDLDANGNDVTGVNLVMYLVRLLMELILMIVLFLNHFSMHNKEVMALLEEQHKENLVMVLLLLL